MVRCLIFIYEAMPVCVDSESVICLYGFLPNQAYYKATLTSGRPSYKSTIVWNKPFMNVKCNQGLYHYSMPLSVFYTHKGLQLYGNLYIRAVTYKRTYRLNGPKCRGGGGAATVI